MSQTACKINHALWEPDGSCVVVLASDWSKDADVPPLVLKSGGLEFGPPELLNKAKVGSYFSYYRDDKSYIFVVYLANYPWLPETKPRVFLAADFNGWGEAIGKPEWELFSSGKAKRDVYELRVPTDSIPGSKSFQFKFVTEDGIWLDVPETALNAVQPSEGIVNFEFSPHQTGRHCFQFRMPEGRVPVGNEKIVWRDGAHEDYNLFDLERLLSISTDLPLGAIVERNQTTFRLFAPRASEVQLVYGFETDQSDATVLSMHCVDGVTWEVVLKENLAGACYSFRINGKNADKTTDFDPNFDVLDPYAKACCGNFGPGIVVDAMRLKKVKKSYKAPLWKDLVILEGHVRDFVARAPLALTTEEREGFVGLRKWIESDSSYLRELGVNAVELQPVQQIGDFLNRGYHWGYMPVSYFSPESSYASEPGNASQIEEFRDLVRAFHEQNMAVIIDVVYNHVGEPYHLSHIDKYYYFHLNENEEMVNWSGCGNDLRCNTPMARRLIIESLKHFLEVYDVDGFRFDLAELIGFDVLCEIEKELKKIKPSIILIAEPWSFRGHIQHELKESGFASWNDGFRESVVDYICNKGTAEMIQYFLSGSPGSSQFVAQTINYTESHDDRCWIDRITEQPEHDGSSPTWLDQRRTHLMASILFSALGVPMLSAGQDFMRTKLGISNTYRRGDINALDYDRRLIHSGTHAYFCDWIRFRLSAFGKALRYEGQLQEGYLKFFTTESSNAIVAVFNADYSVDGSRLVYAINPHSERVRLKCEVDTFEGMVQIADHERFDVRGLQSALIVTDGGVARLPSYSCGLWLAR